MPRLRKVAADCRACPLWRNATQTVFGEGVPNARLMLIGEQPGNEEDLQGHVFVGPAGKLLDRALVAAGIDRKDAYVTNVVKHFKWVPKGKRRLHQKPNAREVGACIPWLEAEIELVKPDGLVCLGATAAQALFGRAFRVSRERGKPLATQLAPHALATVHPSSILRAPDPAQREREFGQFVEDLRVARAWLRRRGR